MKFEMPILPYELNALEPYMPVRTLEFHYGKHLKAYLNNLNSLILGTKFENEDLETIINTAEGPILYNASQVWNHIFFFGGLNSARNYNPHGFVESAIQDNFGSFIEFKNSFIHKAVKLFGSGWIWLIINSEGELEIVTEKNAGNPIRKGLKPILACDMWEHAYYLEYQNRRIDYLNAFWNLVDWNVIENRYNREM